jgi:CheY-like chemotaxis protein
MTEINILVADNDSAFRESLIKDVLEPEGYVVSQAGSLEEAYKVLGENRIIHLDIVDLRLTNDNDPNDQSGLTLVAKMEGAIASIVLTGYPPGGLGHFPRRTEFPLNDRSAWFRLD